VTEEKQDKQADGNDGKYFVICLSEFYSHLFPLRGDNFCNIAIAGKYVIGNIQN
jgi:hypothetical protein